MKDPSIVFWLQRAIYGLKQAILAWWYQLNTSMKELGFEHLKSEAGIFHYKKKDRPYYSCSLC